MQNAPKNIHLGEVLLAYVIINEDIDITETILENYKNTLSKEIKYFENSKNDNEIFNQKIEIIKQICKQ